MTAAIVCIGTELTRGEIVNTNAAWLAEELTLLDVEVAEVVEVPDEPERIRAALARLGAAHDWIVSTGGLGPTTDDLTSESVAALLGVPLDRDEASLEAIRARMTRFGRPMAASNAKQADFPRGARVLPNARGTAPGFSVRIGGATAFFLPGVPHEMKGMFAEHIAREVAASARAAVHQVRLRTFGLPESAVNDRLDGIEAAFGVVIAYRAHFPEIEVKVRARAEAPADAKARAQAAAAEVRARLGDAVFAEGDTALPEAIGALLRERRLSFGTAESCTGGLVAELMTEHAGASDYFKGSIVSYDNHLKADLLGVNPDLIAEKGAVSREVAREMALGAVRALGVDVALSITGVAGPGGGTPEKPVGLVYYAVATREGVSSRELRFPGTRSFVRLLSAYAGLFLVRTVVTTGHIDDA